MHMHHPLGGGGCHGSHGSHAWPAALTTRHAKTICGGGSRSGGGWGGQEGLEYGVLSPAMVQTGGVSGAAAYAACGGSGGLHETQTVEAYVDMNWRRFQQLGLAPQEHTEIKSYVVQVSTVC